MFAPKASGAPGAQAVAHITYACCTPRQMRAAHPPVASLPVTAAALEVLIGRQLTRSSQFTRRMVLDRWFLRREA